MSKLKYFDGTNWKVVNGQITGDTLPIGAIVPFGGWNAPTGWLICNGTLLNKTAYPELFNAIGYSFGGEDGGSTFGLPDLRGRVPVGEKDNDSDFDGMGVTGGEKTHTLTIQEMPVHNHELAITGGTETGARFSYDYASGKRYYGGQDIIQNAGNGAAHNNLQPYQVVCYIIKAKQSAGVVANVSNIQSDSTTDTYSCDYINNTIAELKPYVLFAGSTTGTVTLNDSAANYTFLEIYYQGASNFNSTKIYNPNGKQAFLISGWLNTNTNGNVKLANIQISGTSITKIKTTSLNYDTNYTNASEENGLSITTVIGYK